MKLTISEGEKDLIRRMHNNQKSYDVLIKESVGLVSTVSESVVITDWVSPDDRYLILFDNLYDLQSRTNLGDIWENFDTGIVWYIGMAGKINQRGDLVNHSVKKRLQASRKKDDLTGRDIQTNKYIYNFLFLIYKYFSLI